MVPSEDQGAEEDCELGAANFADQRRRYQSINCFGTPGFRELDHAGRRERDLRIKFFGRFGMALFGGFAIMVPVVILSAWNFGLGVLLAIVGVFIFGFAFFLAVVGRRSTGQTVLAHTACYASVLTMFIGRYASIPSPSEPPI
jgi:hypothetical protein